MLSINNTRIEKMSTKDINVLTIMKPEIQRIIDNSKVEEIIKMQLEYFKEHNHFNLSASSPLNIHFYENKYWLLDGQHRLSAMEKLYTHYGHNIEVYVQIVNVDNYEELKNNYEMINMNTPLPDFTIYSDVDKNIPESVANYFQLIYPKIWSRNRKARRPHIYFNYFQETLAYICEQLKIKDIEVLKDIIIKYNERLSKWGADAFEKSYKVNESIYKIANEQGFYIGLFSYQPSEEYGYQWAKKIVEENTGKIIKSTSSYSKKKKIPKKIKNDSWDKNVGKDVGETTCICCRISEINAKDFIAGHIISEKNGGKVIVENILPICNQCNSSMGVMNMDEYINEYYPNNYEKFEKREYQKKENKFWAYFQ